MSENRVHIFQALFLLSHRNKQYVKINKIDHKDVCIMHCNFSTKSFFFFKIRTSEALISLVQQIVKINIHSLIHLFIHMGSASQFVKCAKRNVVPLV